MARHLSVLVMNGAGAVRSSVSLRNRSEHRVYDQIDARMQFVSFAAGTLVGRCGGNWSVVSVLSPPLLALIGEWVVFPHLCAVVLLAGPYGIPPTQHVMFTLSPTLGLVDYPSVVDFGLMNRFRGWVGPSCSRPLHPSNDHYGSRGCWRFAVVNDGGSGLGYNISVIDTGNGAAEIITKNRMSMSDIWKNNWKWGVLVDNKHRAMTLWNFELLLGSECCGVREANGTMDLPWSVSSFAFDGTDFMVFMLNPTDEQASFSRSQKLVTVDLQASWEQQRVVVTGSPTLFIGEAGAIWCWRGNVYTTTRDGSLCCITTGQVTTSHKGNQVLNPIGGPYFSTKSFSCFPKEVYSVEEPTKLCHRHKVDRGSIHLAHELGVRDPGWAKKNRYFEIVDAVSGSSVFKMRIEGDFCVSNLW
ncbi:hypothetical protein Pelo_4515 [Pelomyxa schiedti]|nr:hypothetical protein Pelo_4515 [Pelomyxa schiedti]